jgi:hypothetical protein
MLRFTVTIGCVIAVALALSGAVRERATCAHRELAASQGPAAAVDCVVPQFGGRGRLLTLR